MDPVAFRTKTDALSVLTEMIAIASGTRCHVAMDDFKNLCGIRDIRYKDSTTFWNAADLKNKAEVKKVGKKWELTLPEPHSLT